MTGFRWATASPTPAELRISDVRALLGVVRLGSINAAARGTRASPSQLSKSIARLERAVGVRLLARSAQGVELTDAGRELAPRFIDVLDSVQAIRTGRSESAHLTVVAPSFVNQQFLPAIVTALPGIAVDSVDAPPGVPSAYASRPLFDLALTLRDGRWTDSWARATVGSFRLGLFASPRTAWRLGSPLGPERLREETFIGPLYNNGDELRPGDDGCPLPASERTFGHRTQTFTMALALAETTSQIVFGPVIAATAHVAAGALVEIPVEGWNVRERLYLDCHQERVSARVQRAVLVALRRRLRALGSGRAARR
ncbi:MAG: LysR family transcriptional regulator [Myxococcales bacterium]|nr:LysR family transcriptional regulator [Myxococcales bacterium]